MPWGGDSGSHPHPLAGLGLRAHCATRGLPALMIGTWGGGRGVLALPRKGVVESPCASLRAQAPSLIRPGFIRQGCEFQGPWLLTGVGSV